MLTNLPGLLLDNCALRRPDVLVGFGSVLSVCLLFLLALPPKSVRAGSHIIYVDGDATGQDDGSSWTDAYTDLQVALQNASTNTEIWVASGVYQPGTLPTNTFQLKNGVALYGGFDGTETQRDQRDWQLNVTVLSGDIDNNDTTDENGIITDTDAVTGRNSYNVVRGIYSEHTAIMDGFTITGGRADQAFKRSQSRSIS